MSCVSLIDAGRTLHDNRYHVHFFRKNQMAWTKPIIREIECGMEINMYGPDSEEDAGGVLF